MYHILSSFFEIYEEDKKKRVKENTWESKSYVIRTKILPFLGERKIAEIEPKDVISWQNELLSYKGENGGSIENKGIVVDKRKNILLKCRRKCDL